MELKKVPSPPLHLLPRLFFPAAFGGEASCSSGGQRVEDFHDPPQVRYPLPYPQDYISPEGKKSLKKEENEIVSFSGDYLTLGDVRKVYLEDKNEMLDLEGMEALVNKYERWVKEPLYLVFENEKKGNKLFRLASKRGNSVYKWKTTQRLEKGTSFFDKKSFKKLLKRRGKGGFWITNVLFITLTNDTKRWGERKYIECDIWGNEREMFIEGDRIKAWRNIQPEYNRFITAFRKKYGKTWPLKCFESSKNGYPHPHLLLVTKKYWFIHPRRKRIMKKGDIRWITEWRLGKTKKDKKEKEEISKLWHSFVDVKAPATLKSLKNYVYKDITKQFRKSLSLQSKLSLALNWLFRKRSFSISGKKIIYDLINERITQTEKTPKIDVFDENWKFLGLVVVHFSKDPPFLYEKKLSEELEMELNQSLGSEY